MARMPSGAWYVYLVECRDGTLYTGVARDVERRVGEHNAGRGARYTRGRAPVRVIAASRALDKRAAYQLEYAVKRLPRTAKATAVRRARPPSPDQPAGGAKGPGAGGSSERARSSSSAQRARVRRPRRRLRRKPSTSSTAAKTQISMPKSPAGSMR